MLGDFASQLRQDLAPADVTHVLAVFAADAMRLSAAWRQALDGDDLTAFRRLAHELAGAAGAVGAASLEQAARSALLGIDLAAARAVSGRLGELVDKAVQQARHADVGAVA